jgi:hypothetical protein
MRLLSHVSGQYLNGLTLLVIDDAHPQLYTRHQQVKERKRSFSKERNMLSKLFLILTALAMAAAEGQIGDLSCGKDKPPCGGFAAFRCPEGLHCHYPETGPCVPSKGGRDCLGYCI